MNNENEECRKKRIELPYKNESQNYRLNKADADGNKFAKRQYIHLYRIRAGLLKGRLIRNARRILGVEKLTVLTDLNSRRGNDAVFVVGTIFKRMKFRRNVLYEFADDSNFQEKFTKAPSANLTDEEDVLELEENQQVLKLIGNIYKHHFVTGDTIGIYGSQEEGTDEFTVKRVIFPELPQQVPWPLIEKDCYLAFISGMSLSGKVADCYRTRMALDAFQKWINGAVVPSDTEADEEEECQIVQNIDRLIIAGDWARMNKPTEAIQWKKVANFSVDSEADMDCFAAIDRYLLRFMQNMPIDLMPGANDPVQCAIPQQPVPWVIFNAGQKFRPLLNAVTNPYAFSVAGLQFLGTSGQNLNDLERLTRDIPAMERMERTLKMCHLFPTVPETLDGFPFGMRDPLILDQMPHVYFCGNQAEFGVKMLDPVENSEGGKGANSGNRCLLLAIPKFSETFEAVLLNLRTLQATPYSFNFDWDLDGSEQGDGEEEEMPIDDGGGKTTGEQAGKKDKEEKAELQEEEQRPEPMDEE